MRAREASEKSKDEDLLETNTGGTKKVYIEKSEARAKKTRTLEDEDEQSVDPLGLQSGCQRVVAACPG